MVFAFLEHQLGTKRHTHIIEPEYEVSDEAASAALAAFDNGNKRLVVRKVRRVSGWNEAARSENLYHI